MPELPTMMNPPIEDLLDRVDSKFTLVTLAARRGRQINTYFNSLGDGLGAVVPPQVASLARKPLSIALEEVAAGKIGYVRSGDAADAGVADDPVDPTGDAAADGNATTGATGVPPTLLSDADHPTAE